LSSNPGVYLFLNKKGIVIYVGKAKNLKTRVASYFSSGKLSPKTAILVSEISKIKTVELDSEIESLLVEAYLIKKYKPKYNIKLINGKAYPLIRITIKDKYPKILTARKVDDKKSLYFGPFPHTGAMRLVLKTIRKVFPYQSVLNHPKKTCLYYHLGLCPCPEVFGDADYKNNIKHIIYFLKGETKKVLKDLMIQRNKASANEEYEIAEKIQKRINAIKIITSPSYKPFEYDLNPNLREDRRKQELDMLAEILNDKNYKIKKLNKIECFDVSSISGKIAVGSMVVFINGESEKSLYRKFKLNLISNEKLNDVSAMQQIIERRLNHKEWPRADLIVVDGGKGQISAAKKALKNKNEEISVIGLTKREETIITENFDTISVSKDSVLLHLVMRIRDEAHRFAVNYHKKLRSKTIFS